MADPFIKTSQIVAFCKSRPLSANVITVVAFSTLIKAFVTGLAPQFLPVISLLQWPFLLAMAMTNFRKIRGMRYFMEFCWFLNAIGYILIVHEILATSGLMDPFIDERTRNNLGIAYFVIANGPVASAIIINDCKFVMHDGAKMASLFIHFTPALISWAIRWRNVAYDENHSWAPFDQNGSFFASASATSEHREISFFHLIYYPVCFYLAWWVPYTLWLLVSGCKVMTLPEDKKVKSSFKDVVGKFPENWPLRVKALAYCVGHATVNAILYAIAAVMYYNVYLHFFWLFALLFKSVNSGAKEYEEKYMYCGKRDTLVADLKKLADTEQSGGGRRRRGGGRRRRGGGGRGRR
jgi:hypothetical protein